MNILENQTFHKYLTDDELVLLQHCINTKGKNVILYQCECCDKWAAFHTTSHLITIPVDEAIADNKEDAINWLRGLGFIIVGELINNKIQHFN